ncbi:MAG TPA: bifunctional diaminohydroxyphosphoribosylaminopyrimidine deaminase/5-amino-6-(5-phosphoribosylamino)uracil reductase RibD [Nocardioidaceae bacterium]|nr:bifunctional diaminohydroxyphosphoribosylaminopyrimidine deaminase/5-amino-6-(5-phosphoribosylamino)uracil reductase RibD [Nocardioidaceae bacterium]
MASQAEIAAMRRAIEIAASPGVPLGPNPRVGCVLVAADGTSLAEGFHRGAGSAHAEVAALDAAGSAARGATAVVSLEPCNHSGRTGPCAEALIEAGVARVVYAQHDSNPVARGGADRLAGAGIDVEAGVLADESGQVNRAWTFATRHRRPFVTWKFAASLDGRSAAVDGSSRWITSPSARADVHRLRAGCDAIVVGTGTVLADDPQLTVRLGESAGLPAGGRQPLRVVVGRAEVPAAARVLDDTAETLHLRTRDVRAVLAQLWQRGRQHVWLEGGPTLAAAFWRAGVVDEVVAYVAPVLLGAGRNALADTGITSIDEALRLRVCDVTRIGSDLRLTAVPERESADVHRNRGGAGDGGLDRVRQPR